MKLIPTTLLAITLILLSPEGFAADTANDKGQTPNVTATELTKSPADTTAINTYIITSLQQFAKIMDTDRAGAEAILEELDTTLKMVEAKDDAAKTLLSRKKNIASYYSKLLELHYTPMKKILAQIKEDPSNVKAIGQYLSKTQSLIGPLMSSKPDFAKSELAAAKKFLTGLKENKPTEKALKKLEKSIVQLTRMETSIASSREQAKNHASIIGKAAAPLDIKDWANGDPISDEELKGKVVLLDFWAVWCGPCIATFPHLRDWNEEFGDKGLVMIGLTRYYNFAWNESTKRSSKSMDKLTPEMERAEMEKFAAHHKLKHRFAIQADTKFSEHYFVSGIPHVVLIDRKGEVRLMKVGSGEANAKEIEAMIKKLIKVEPLGALATELTSLSPGMNEIQVKHDGRSRRLIITTPKTFGRQCPYPVLFCFHGAGGNADGTSKRWSAHADKRGLIVISAEAVQPLAKWNFRDKFHAEEHDDVGFVSKVVEVLIANKIVDPNAIYATGHSSGGLFCYRLAKEIPLFAALSPMSCGMVKGAHDPGEKTKPVSIMQVIGDQDKSFNGSSNPKVTMYSAAKRIDVWRTFNRCRPDPVVVNKGEEVVVYTYANQSGIEVAFCKVKGQGHFIRRDLRDRVDSVALDFLLKHKRR